MKKRTFIKTAGVALAAPVAVASTAVQSACVKQKASPERVIGTIDISGNKLGLLVCSHAADGQAQVLFYQEFNVDHKAPRFAIEMAIHQAHIISAIYTQKESAIDLVLADIDVHYHDTIVECSIHRCGEMLPVWAAQRTTLSVFRRYNVMTTGIMSDHSYIVWNRDDYKPHDDPLPYFHEGVASIRTIDHAMNARWNSPMWSHLVAMQRVGVDMLSSGRDWTV